MDLSSEGAIAGAIVWRIDVHLRGQYSAE